MSKSSKKITSSDIEWTDHVLGMLEDDEKIAGNPTTDGLRRIFELVMECTLIDSTSQVVQSPSPDNEKRATVIHSLTYILKNLPPDSPFNTITVNGAADVYWGNCDKVYRNHPVAVAETRAEGRALRRALKLKKVVAAEELAGEIEDDISSENSTKITVNQINFMDVLSKRLNINTLSLVESLNLDKNIKSLMHDDAVSIIRELSKYQQNIDDIPDNIIGYDEDWKP